MNILDRITEIHKESVYVGNVCGINVYTRDLDFSNILIDSDGIFIYRYGTVIQKDKNCKLTFSGITFIVSRYDIHSRKFTHHPHIRTLYNEGKTFNITPEVYMV